jgi:hypothetical protein
MLCIKNYMGHNELCLLSGLCPRGGPSQPISDDMDLVVEEMADEMKAISGIIFFNDVKRSTPINGQLQGPQERTI